MQQTKEKRRRRKLPDDNPHTLAEKSKPPDTETQLKEKYEECQPVVLAQRRKALAKKTRAQQSPPFAYYSFSSAKQRN